MLFKQKALDWRNLNNYSPAVVMFCCRIDDERVKIEKIWARYRFGVMGLRVAIEKRNGNHIKMRQIDFDAHRDVRQSIELISKRRVLNERVENLLRPSRLVSLAAEWSHKSHRHPNASPKAKTAALLRFPRRWRRLIDTNHCHYSIMWLQIFSS